MAQNIVLETLDLLDAQREAVFDVLGNIHAYDPTIGVANLITGLKVCIDHDELHYDDLLKLAASLLTGR